MSALTHDERACRRSPESLRACRVCACTEDRACPGSPSGAGLDEDGPCYWVDVDLCSACADDDGLPLFPTHATSIETAHGTAIVHGFRPLSPESRRRFERLVEAVAEDLAARDAPGSPAGTGDDGFNPHGSGPEPIQPRED